MSRKIITNLDLNQNEIQNVAIQPLATNPSSPVVGQTYFNTVANEIRTWDGTQWVAGSGGGSGDVNSIETTTVDNQAVLFSGTGGKTIKKSTKNGLIKEVSGVPEEATAGTDYVTEDSANTFTNKTFDVSATGNTLSNVALSNFDSGAITTDLDVSATSSQFARADAVKTYVDALGSALDGSLQFKGDWDASASSFPSGADTGFYYVVSVAGTVDGISFLEGDQLIAKEDNASTSSFADWVKVKSVTPTATESVAGKIQIADSSEATAGTDDTKAMTPKKVKDNYQTNAYVDTFVIADWVGASAPFTLTYTNGTHGKGANSDLSVIVKELSGSDYKNVIADVTVATDGTVTISSNNKIDGSVRIN